MADSIVTKDIANKWGVTQATVSKWCRDEKNKGAEQDEKRNTWYIPKDVALPA